MQSPSAPFIATLPIDLANAVFGPRLDVPGEFHVSTYAQGALMVAFRDVEMVGLPTMKDALNQAAQLLARKKHGHHPYASVTVVDQVTGMKLKVSRSGAGSNPSMQ